MSTTLWVSPDVDTWRLQREGAYRPEKICQTSPPSSTFRAAAVPPRPNLR